MTSTDQERWQQVKKRLRVELGEDVFTSWFARIELETIEKGTIRLSVPTRFLRNWIQSHYSEKVLGHSADRGSGHQPFGIERPLGRHPSASGQAEVRRIVRAAARTARGTAQRRRGARWRAVHGRA